MDRHWHVRLIELLINFANTESIESVFIIADLILIIRHQLI
jgi:hypothetical protein